MSRDDPALIQACLEGRQRAWDELVERYGRLVYSIPRRYRFNDADADDVFQAVFMSLYQHLERLRDQTRISSWLITATHRECWRVGKKRDKYVDLDEVIVDAGSPGDDQVLAWERQQIVREALGELGGRCEQLLTALFLDSASPSYDKVAERLGMKIGSIGPTRARCFQKLQKLLVQMGLQLDPPGGEAAGR